MKFQKYLHHLMSLPHRGLGTVNEKRASDIISKEYAKLGIKVVLQPFVTIYNGLWHFHILYSALFCICCLLGIIQLNQLAIVFFISGLAVYFDEPLALKPLYKKISPAHSQNIIATIPAKNKRISLYITAHYDSARKTYGLSLLKIFSLFTKRKLADHELNITFPFPATLKTPFLFNFISFALIFLALLIANKELLLPKLMLIFAFGIFAVIFTAAGLSSLSPFVPGALDNAAAVAITLDLADYFTNNRLNNVELIFVNTGSEENIEKGIDNFIYNFRPPHKTSYFINLDTIGEKKLVALHGEVNDIGIGINYSVHEFNKVIDLINSNTEFKKRIHTAFAPLATDAASLRGNKYQVITTLVSIGSDGFNRNYHQQSDTAGKLDQKTIALAEKFLIALIDDIERKTGDVKI